MTYKINKSKNQKKHHNDTFSLDLIFQKQNQIQTLRLPSFVFGLDFKNNMLSDSQAQISQLELKDQEVNSKQRYFLGAQLGAATGLLVLFQDHNAYVGQVIAMAIQFSKDIIVTTSGFMNNLPDRASIFYCPNFDHVENNRNSKQNRYLVVAWLFHGVLNQAKPESKIIAVGMLEKGHQIFRYNQIQRSLLSPDLVKVHFFRYYERSQGGLGFSIHKQRFQLTNQAAEINQINHQFIWYNLHSSETSFQKGILSGTPIYQSTLKGPALIGLHIGPSARFTSGSFAIIFSAQFKADLENFICEYQKMGEKIQDLGSLKTIKLKQVQNSRLNYNLGNYLFRQIGCMKVQLFYNQKQLAIKLQDNIKNNIVYSELNQAKLQQSDQLIEQLPQLYNVLLQKIQLQKQDLRRIFTYNSSNLYIKLQNGPLSLTMQTEALCATISTQTNSQNHLMQQTQRRLNSIVRNIITSFDALLASKEERLRLMFLQIQAKLQQLLEKAVKRTEATFNIMAEKIVEELRSSITQEVKVGFDIDKLQFVREELIAQVQQQAKRLQQMIAKQKKQLTQLTLSVLRIENQIQQSFQDLKMRFEESEFANQMNFTRFQEITCHLHMKLQEIAETKSTFFHSICDTTKESKIQSSQQNTEDIISLPNCESKVDVLGIEKGVID